MELETVINIDFIPVGVYPVVKHMLNGKVPTGRKDYPREMSSFMKEISDLESEILRQAIIMGRAELELRTKNEREMESTTTYRVTSSNCYQAIVKLVSQLSC